jgi:hypothetical protein
MLLTVPHVPTDGTWTLSSINFPCGRSMTRGPCHEPGTRSELEVTMIVVTNLILPALLRTTAQDEGCQEINFADAVANPYRI